MKKLSCVVISLTLSSALLTGCGKKVNTVAQAFPDQTLQQQVPQTPSYANPAYQQVPQSADQGYYTPDSPSVNSPNYDNTPTNNNGQYQNVSNENYNTVATPSVQPSIAPTTTAPAVKVPWYKKVIEKVKGIFKKKS